MEHDQITAANALFSLGMQLGVLVGPAIGGLLIAFVGIGWCFVVDVTGLTIATVITLLIVPVLYSIFVLDLKLVKWDLPTPPFVRAAPTSTGAPPGDGGTDAPADEGPHSGGIATP